MQTRRIPLFVLMATLLALLTGVITSSTRPAHAEARTGTQQSGQVSNAPLPRARDARGPFGLGQNAPNVGGRIGAPFVIVDQPFDVVGPSVAYNSRDQEYLVVWSSYHTLYLEIYGQRVSKDGRLTGPAFPISTGTGAKRWAPKIAYNSTSNEYLVVWEDQASLVYTIRGRRVSANGQLLGTEISFITIIAPNTYYEYPAVAYASTSDLYLVVWHEHLVASTYNIVGRTLSGAGALDSGPLTIYQETPGTGPGIAPQLAYNRERNEFLVTWREGSATMAIDGQRVKLTGGTGLLGPHLEFVPSVTTSYGFAVAALPYPSGVGQYLVIGEQQASPTQWTLTMRRLTGDGTLQGGPSVVTSLPSSGSYPAIAGSEGGREYLLTWAHRTGASSFIRRRSISSEGVALNENPDGLGILAMGSSVAAGPYADFLVVYQENHTSDECLTGVCDLLGALFGNRIHMPFLTR